MFLDSPSLHIGLIAISFVCKKIVLSNPDYQVSIVPTNLYVGDMYLSFSIYKKRLMTLGYMRMHQSTRGVFSKELILFLVFSFFFFWFSFVAHQIIDKTCKIVDQFYISFLKLLFHYCYLQKKKSIILKKILKYI